MFGDTNMKKKIIWVPIHINGEKPSYEISSILGLKTDKVISLLVMDRY